MTRDDYYNMAVASGLWQSKPIYDTALMAIDLMKFVEMVVAAEREACAKLCYEIAGNGNAFDCMDAIHARTESDRREEFFRKFGND